MKNIFSIFPFHFSSRWEKVLLCLICLSTYLWTSIYGQVAPPPFLKFFYWCALLRYARESATGLMHVTDGSSQNAGPFLSLHFTPLLKRKKQKLSLWRPLPDRRKDIQDGAEQRTSLDFWLLFPLLSPWGSAPFTASPTSPGDFKNHPNVKSTFWKRRLKHIPLHSPSPSICLHH